MELMPYKQIKKLVQYGLQTELITQEDVIYVTNLLLATLELNDYQDTNIDNEIIELEDVLNELIRYAIEKGMISDSTVQRDLFDTKLMNCLVPPPREVICKFYKHYKKSPEAATTYFYEFCHNSDYIRRYRVKKDMKWVTASPYGDMNITINLSKPEKDPKVIAEQRLLKQIGYPKCQLCLENVGYAGRVDHPARQNLRVIPITLHNSGWGFQYSPYTYYKEHCIVINEEHIPMVIEKETLIKLFDFIKLFPHYFIGSNADLPIVGGSILSHEHFQGGNYQFPMALAPMEQTFCIPGFSDVEAGIVKWPLSVIRISCNDAKRLIDLGAHILENWRGYTDEESFLYATTNGQTHNTITPIARKVNNLFQLDLVLRNNITTKEHPLGVFHPHAELHHIKKENIGLIEVMGLAVLPPRLKEEMQQLAQYILNGKDVSNNEMIRKHALWVEQFLPKYTEITAENIMNILQEEIGQVFVKVLEDAGVFKCNKEGRNAFMKFIRKL
jgi:UDPglucose--hexose-1-phosphate uridylyltransferase